MTRPVLATFFLLLLGLETLHGEAFVRFDSLEGGSRERAHLKWSDCDASSLFLYRLRGSARPQLTRLQLRKPVDSVSPSLSAVCASGQMLDSIKLDFTRNDPSNGQTIYFQLNLEDCRILSLSTSGARQGGPPNEVMDIEFARIVWLTARADGSSKGSFWDVSKDSGSELDSGFFKVNGIVLSSGVVNLTWTAQAGQKFRVTGSPKVDGPYQLLRAVVATQTGPLDVALPASQSSLFFNIERLP